MHTCRHVSLLTAAGLMSWLLQAPAAQAQVGPAAPAAGADDNGLTEIVVTATRREENLQSVPISIGVVTADDVKSLNLLNSGDLQRVAPTLQFSVGPIADSDVFSIRGVGTVANSGGLEESVGVAIDGVPLARALGSLVNLVDLDHVEVLNGPQGTLFGKNASAGLVSVITQKPKLGEYEFDAHLSDATLNYVQENGVVNLPIGSTAAVRVAAWHNERDGFVNFFEAGKELGDLDDEGARIKVRWDPITALDIIFTGEFTDHHDNGSAVTIRSFDPAHFTLGGEQGAAEAEAYETAHGVVAANNNLQNSFDSSPLYDKGHTQAFTLETNYDLDGPTLSGIFSARSVKDDTIFNASGTGNINPATGLPYAGDTLIGDNADYTQATAEVRLASASDQRLRYVVGAFYYHLNFNEEFALDTEGGQTPTTASIVTNEKEGTINYAVFGEGNFSVTPRLRLLLGARYSHDAITGSFDRVYGDIPPAFICCGPAFNFNGPGGLFGPFAANTSDSNGNLSGRGSVQFDVTPTAMAYLTASRGYKGPGLSYSLTSTASVGNAIVAPEISTNYEVGFKSLWFDRRLRVNVAVFDETFDNFQASVRLPGAAPSFVLQNAKQLKSDGVDLDFEGKVTRDFTVSGGLDYNHARYTDYTNASCYPGEPTATVPGGPGCQANGTQSLNGYPLQDSPRWTWVMTARYEHNLGALLRGFLQAGEQYKSATAFDTVADPYETQSGYHIFNFSMGVMSTDNHVSARIFVNNAFNEYFVSRVGVNQGGAWYLNTPTYDALRSIGGAVDVHF